MQQESSERRFLQSTFASYVSVIVRLAITFGARMLVARLVLPEGRGLFELALRIVTIAAAFRDLGLVHHLIRDRDRPYGTVFGFTLATGVTLSAGLMLGAPLFAFLNPDLPAVLRVFAIWILLDGLMQVPRTYFERGMRLGRLLGPEILRGAAMASISVWLAWLGWGVWSFVVGELVATGIFVVLVWWRAWGEIPLRFEAGLIPRLLRSSRMLFFIWIVGQVVSHVDLFIVQVFSDTAPVGHYSQAYWIVMLLPYLVAPRALLPALVEYRDRPERFAEVFRLGAILILSCQVIAGYFFFLNAHKIIAILLGPNWGPAVPLLQVLCFVPFLDISGRFGGEVLKAKHEDRSWLLIECVNLVCLVGFGILFTYRWGALGMAWANFLYLGNIFMVYRLSVILGPAFRKLLRDVGFVWVVPIPFFVLAALFPSDSWPRFAASTVAAGGAAAVLGHRLYRPFRDFFDSR